MEKISTIAAIATGMTNSGIGIIRMSGPDSILIADKIFKGKKLCNQISHTVHYGHIVDGDEVIDEVMIIIMLGPKTYTKEDTVEINCHGGMLVTKKILDTVLKYGARAAEPGEFTKRAFLSGRIDLSQAEAVMDIIQAENELSLKNSVNQLKGNIYYKITDIRKEILYHLAYIESALDDPEHYNMENYGDKLLGIVNKLISKLSHIIDLSENGILIKKGIKTVIVGKPNAGKSSLMNMLAGEDRAIVTSIAGTTRDILEEKISISGIQLNIIDTAGIRKTDNIIEKIGIEKAKEFAQKADFLIYVVDSSVPLDQNDEEIMDIIKNRRGIILLNKSDLEQVINEDIISNKTGMDIIKISAKNETGIKELYDKIKNLFFSGELLENNDIILTNARQKKAVIEAVESLELVKNSIMNKMPEDFYSIDLTNCYENLGSITGETMGEDLVNEIFSKFCTGK